MDELYIAWTRWRFAKGKILFSMDFLVNDVKSVFYNYLDSFFVTDLRILFKKHKSNNNIWLWKFSRIRISRIFHKKKNFFRENTVKNYGSYNYFDTIPFVKSNIIVVTILVVPRIWNKKIQKAFYSVWM